MIELPIETVLSYDAGPIAPGASVREAASQLRKPDVPALVVLDGRDRVVGIVTESDVVACVAETTEPVAVERIMSTPVATVSLSTTIRTAAKRMAEAGVRQLPVVDSGGAYCGVVTDAALAPYCARNKLDVEWSGEPLAIDATESPDAIADD